LPSRDPKKNPTLLLPTHNEDIGDKIIVGLDQAGGKAVIETSRKLGARRTRQKI